MVVISVTAGRSANSAIYPLARCQIHRRAGLPFLLPIASRILLVTGKCLPQASELREKCPIRTGDITSILVGRCQYKHTFQEKQKRDSLGIPFCPPRVFSPVLPCVSLQIVEFREIVDRFLASRIQPDRGVEVLTRLLIVLHGLMDEAELNVRLVAARI